MVNILKIIRGGVKAIAVLITLAFVVNSLTGVTTILNLVNNQGISVDDIEPGDFHFSYDNLTISLGITINNTGIYDMKNVKLSIKCELRTNLTNQWSEVLDTDSTVLASNPTPEGETIAAGQSSTLLIDAQLIDFSKSPQEIADDLGIEDPNWDLASLTNATFDIRVFIEFTIAYAFGQYDITVNVDLLGDDAKQGVGA